MKHGSVVKSLIWNNVIVSVHGLRDTCCIDVQYHFVELGVNVFRIYGSVLLFSFLPSAYFRDRVSKGGCALLLGPQWLKFN